MTRCLGSFILALALFLLTLGLDADEIKGKVQSVDVKKRQVALIVNTKDGKDVKDNKVQRYAVAKDVTIVSVTTATKQKPAQIVPVDGGLAALRPGTAVTVTTDTVDDMEVVTVIKLDTLIPTADAKKKKK